MATMTIRGCMDFALQLLNQYSIAGALVPLSYNDQADAENRMINLINDAQMEIATTVRPIDELQDYIVPEVPINTPLEDIVCEVPEDYYRHEAMYFTPLKGRVRVMIDAAHYKWIGEHTLLLPNKPAGTYTMQYCRYPHRYEADVDKDTPLDNTPDTHEIIPYYVAAMIALDENPKAYYALYNVWETRLSRLGMKAPHAVSTLVQDVYGFDNFRGLW